MLGKKLKYYIAEFYDKQLFDAGVVRKDNEALLDELGFRKIKFRGKGLSVFLKPARFIKALFVSLRLKKNCQVIFHFPLQANLYKVMLRILNKQKVETIALIIDLDGLRDKNETLMQEEIEQLNQFTQVIAHNESMKDMLAKQIPAEKISCINLFDYPFTGSAPERKLSNTVCVAGNFLKAGYVYKLNQLQPLHFNLYGPGYESSNDTDPAINYKGIIAAEILPEMLEGSFGLVWDGNSIDECDEYLHYNNPHKLSLYLVAGLPVVVWEGSAVAGLVEDNGLGITISSLRELPEKLNDISNAEYNLMCHQVHSVGEKVRQGFFLKKVIRELESKQKS